MGEDGVIGKNGVVMVTSMTDTLGSDWDIESGCHRIPNVENEDEWIITRHKYILSPFFIGNRPFNQDEFNHFAKDECDFDVFKKVE